MIICLKKDVLFFVTSQKQLNRRISPVLYLQLYLQLWLDPTRITRSCENNENNKITQE